MTTKALSPKDKQMTRVDRYVSLLSAILLLSFVLSYDGYKNISVIVAIISNVVFTLYFIYIYSPNSAVEAWKESGHLKYYSKLYSNYSVTEYITAGSFVIIFILMTTLETNSAKLNNLWYIVSNIYWITFFSGIIIIIISRVKRLYFSNNSD